MPTIDPTRNRTTLINIFTVESRDKQDELIASLREVTEGIMRHLPGYVAASVHRGYDDHHVINYAQWESSEQFKEMLRNPEVAPHMAKVKSIALTIDPVLYEIAFVDETVT